MRVLCCSFLSWVLVRGAPLLVTASSSDPEAAAAELPELSTARRAHCSSPLAGFQVRLIWLLIRCSFVHISLLCVSHFNSFLEPAVLLIGVSEQNWDGLIAHTCDSHLSVFKRAK